MPADLAAPDASTLAARAEFDRLLTRGMAFLGGRVALLDRARSWMASIEGPIRWADPCLPLGRSGHQPYAAEWQKKKYSTADARRCTQMDRAKRSAGSLLRRAGLAGRSEAAQSICVHLRASAVEFSCFSLGRQCRPKCRSTQCRKHPTDLTKTTKHLALIAALLAFAGNASALAQGATTTPSLNDIASGKSCPVQMDGVRGGIFIFARSSTGLNALIYRSTDAALFRGMKGGSLPIAQAASKMQDEAVHPVTVVGERLKLSNGYGANIDLGFISDGKGINGQAVLSRSGSIVKIEGYCVSR
jgi:hypothetical protein